MLSTSRKVIPTSGSDSENINRKLVHLRNWLDDNPNINACKDFNNITTFLQSCKYDVEKTKNKLKRFYIMRAERSEWFSNRDPFLPEIQELLKLGVFLPLDGKDEQNRQVVVIRTAAHNPRVHTQNNVFKVSKMILDLLLQMEPNISVHGIIAIFDMQSVQLGHALQLNPRLIKHSVDSWQTYPCKPKVLEFVNSPTHVNMFLNTFRFFMSSKMRSRIVVQENQTSVKIPSLPKDLGGKGPSYNDLSIRWKKLIEENACFFAEQEKYKSIMN